jgi:O-antigen ligase
VGILLISIVFIPEIRFVFENIIQRFFNIFAGTEDDSTRVRVILFIAAFNMIIDSYMLGIGFLGYASYFTHYFTLQETIGVALPHNLFYTLFAELGLIGFLLYVWILYKMGSVAYRNYKHSPDGLKGVVNLSLFLSYLSYLFFYQFYDGGLVDNNFWIVVGAIFSIRYFDYFKADQVVRNVAK